MEQRKKSKRASILVGLTVITAIVIVASALVFPASASTVQERGHWVDNLGPGFTAAQFKGGNTNQICASSPIDDRNSDLWVFEITGATDPRSIPRWDASVPSWTSVGPVEVRDVTADYGVYLPTTATKRLYIETSPPGAQLNAAHLLYEGASNSEVLLFTCAHDLQIGLMAPLTATYDMEYGWLVEADIKWTANHPYIFDIEYFTHRTRNPVPMIRRGSLHVRGAIRFGGPITKGTSLTVEYQGGESTIPCSVDVSTLVFDCQIDDRFVAHDPDTGRPRGVGYVSVSLQADNGPSTRRFAIDWSTHPPSNILRSDAGIRNHAAMAPRDEIPVAPFATTSVYHETWTPSGDYCSENRQVFELASSPNDGTLTEDLVVATITWCRPRPGYSLQYLGGPYGYPLLVASNSSLRTRFPTVLGDLPPLVTRDDVREFLGSVACLESCRPLLRAQFLTASLNALDPDFAGQQILIDGNCTTVADYLDDIEAEAPGLDETSVVVRKAELERINGALITTCPTVAVFRNDLVDSPVG